MESWLPLPPRQQHLTENRNNPPRLSSSVEREGAQQCGQSEVAFLFLHDAFGRAEVLYQGSRAEYPGLLGQGKMLHRRQLRAKLPGEGPSSQPSFGDWHCIMKSEGSYPSKG